MFRRWNRLLDSLDEGRDGRLVDDAERRASQEDSHSREDGLVQLLNAS